MLAIYNVFSVSTYGPERHITRRYQVEPFENRNLTKKKHDTGVSAIDRFSGDLVVQCTRGIYARRATVGARLP